VSVQLSPVRRGDIGDFVTATGRLDVLRRQKVLSPVAGTLLTLKVLEGGIVKRGDVLATIVPRESQAAIIGAETLLHSATTEAARREAERAVALARETQNVVSVHASFDGVVATRNVTEGELVTDNAELMTIVDLSTIVFVADVPLPEAPRVRVGQRAVLEFQSLPATRFPAIVDALYPGSDIQSQTISVRLRRSGPGGNSRGLLRPSTMGVCHILTGVHRNVLYVPKAALLRNDENESYSVVIVTRDSIARVLSVAVGASTDSTVEVSADGLAEGTPVVIEGNYALPDSTRVRW
jgi:RND family efflux transporter MFP subunit